ncbi:MAG: non-ribosomal peptide synthetase, partial [Gammaproteobacteria bacterium]
MVFSKEISGAVEASGIAGTQCNEVRSCNAGDKPGFIKRFEPKKSEFDQDFYYENLGISRDEYKKVMPLTSMQRDLYMDSVLNPETMQNSLGYAVKLNTEIDVDLWKNACQIVSDSQSILRTRVIRSYDQSLDFAYQCVKREHQIDFTYMDLSSKAMDDERLKGIVESEIYKKYDVDNDSLVNYVLIKIAPECFITILATHHIIMDGIGFASQLISVCQCYESLLDSKAHPDAKVYEPLEDVFEEYVLFNNDTFDSEKVISFWKDMLKYVEPLDFHVAEEERESKPRKISKTVEVASDHWSNIQKYCRKNRITPAIYFKCLYGLLLKEYCRAETDFYIVELSAGRPKGHAAAIGCYFQQIPFVFPFELMKKSSTINDLFLYARDYQRSLKENRNLSISKQRQLLPHGRIGFMYNFIHFFPKLELLGKEEKINQYMNDVDGQVQFVPKVIDGSLFLNLYYHEGDFLDFDFLDRVVSLSKQLICGKEDFISLEFVSNDEIEKQLYTWNDTEVVRENISCMQHLIEQQVEKTPGLVALIFEDQKMTYSDLNARANQLAAYLRNCGVGKNSLVGLCADRSFEMVIGILAIIKAGGAYVPIDPTYPRDRIRYIIDDSKVSIILTQGENCEVIKNKGVDYLEIDKSWGKISKFSEDNLSQINESSDLINVIYTSGSTGKPKGVMVPHSGIVNRILWMQEEYKLDRKDIVLQKTPYSFDVSVWEFFWPLMFGNKMVIAKPNGHKDPNYLADLIEKERVTTLHFVPSMLAVFLYADEIEEKCSSLKRVFCSGEALSFEHERRFFDRIKSSELHNLYGPTEASIDVSYWQCLPDNEDFVLPIGKPIANTQLYILDNSLKMLPIGVAGELFIGGAGLAHGYINKPELTEKKFVQNPFDKTGKSKLYKTGDLAKYR